ncbi:putative aldose 1-epimerase [Helianthus annuus]|nr:putative aldose 1-epimerase [Helianthus annuus]KAJ0696847.1 putative aldose 1-epimerase [Helianthus annuus]KAJ0879595.1 putative aldose 1-epimerase [Helianthus annuus]
MSAQTHPNASFSLSSLSPLSLSLSSLPLLLVDTSISLFSFSFSLLSPPSLLFLFLSPRFLSSLAAIVWDKKSKRSMKLTTDAPGVRFYTGNYVKDVKGKGGYVYEAHAGLCLETQGFPDAVNHPNFPSQIVNLGQTYKHRMLFAFSIYD